MVLSSIIMNILDGLLDYENSIMKGICYHLERDKGFTYQTLLEVSHTVSLVFLFVIHAM